MSSEISTLPTRLRQRLAAEVAKPEGRIRCEWVLRLIDEYGFTPDQIEINVAAGAGRNAERGSIKSRRYKDVFTTKFTDTHPPAIDLDDETIAFIVRHFQGYSLINTSATLEGADVKGTVFEKMVGGTFRGELGAYFTPREIVSFMVQLIAPTIDDVVLDPACGSGGFLIMTLKYVLERLRINRPNLLRTV